MTLEVLRKKVLKVDRLCVQLAQYDGLAIAFSGGVDSVFLAYVASNILGEKAVALTVETPYMAKWEIQESEELATFIGISYTRIQLPLHPSLMNNPSDRCYLCKKILFSQLMASAKNMGIKNLADGSNADDTKDYRPGMRALTELGVKSPLLESGITKTEIREWSKALGLKTWNKPAYACLLTRLPYDMPVELNALEMIEKGEKFFHNLGYKAVRVRKHGDLARIEIDPDRITDLIQNDSIGRIVENFKAFGFKHVTLDLQGYVMGSFNSDLMKGAPNESNGN